MQLLINFLCFIFGVIVTLAGLIYWAWVVGLKERIKRAEKDARDMENVIKQIDEQQKAANAALQDSLAELLIKRRQATQQSINTAVPQVATNPNTSSSSIKDRLKKATEITALQSKIDTRKGPEYIMQYNELELEKLSVLKTILAEGHDPVVTIRYNTGDQEMLLSTYIQSINKGLA